MQRPRSSPTTCPSNSFVAKGSHPASRCTRHVHWVVTPPLSPLIWNSSSSFTWLSWPWHLKATGQLFCRMFLNLGLYDVSRLLDLSHASWQEYHRSDALFSLDHIRWHMILICLILMMFTLIWKYHWKTANWPSFSTVMLVFPHLFISKYLVGR